MANLSTAPGIQAVGAVSAMPSPIPIIPARYSSKTPRFPISPDCRLRQSSVYGNRRRAVTTGYFRRCGFRSCAGGFSLKRTTPALNWSRWWIRISPPLLAARDAIGQRVAMDTIPDVKAQTPRWRTIVGVVGHVKHYALDVEGRDQIYFPHRQPLYGVFAPRDMTLAVRTSLDPSSMTTAIRGQVRQSTRTSRFTASPRWTNSSPIPLPSRG